MFFWKVSSVVPVFVVGKVFEKIVNNRIFDFLEKCGLFSDFQYRFRSSRSAAYPVTVVSNRIANTCNMSGSTGAVTCNISKAFGRVWRTGLLQKLKSYGISGQIFGLISSFLSLLLPLVLHGKFSQEYPVNAGAHQVFIIGPTLFSIYINDLPVDVICNIAIYTLILLCSPKNYSVESVATNRIGFGSGI